MHRTVFGGSLLLMSGSVFSASTLLMHGTVFQASPAGNTSLVEFLVAGDWYLSIYNDNEEPQDIVLQADKIRKL